LYNRNLSQGRTLTINKKPKMWGKLRDYNSISFHSGHPTFFFLQFCPSTLRLMEIDFDHLFQFVFFRVITVLKIHYNVGFMLGFTRKKLVLLLSKKQKLGDQNWHNTKMEAFFKNTVHRLLCWQICLRVLQISSLVSLAR